MWGSAMGASGVRELVVKGSPRWGFKVCSKGGQL